MAQRYNLKSEIQRMQHKHPKWELQLPEVPNPDFGIDVNADAVLYREAVVQVAPVQLFPDEVVALSGTRPVDAARLLLGDRYDHFVAAGGSASLLFAMAQDHAGAEPGESRPSTDS